MNAVDPTMKIMEMMDDPTHWIVVPNVPIFKPHKRKRKDAAGAEHTEVVDKTRLAAIAAKINRQAESAGIFPRIAIGHTIPDKDVPQAKQPPIAGFGRNAKLGRFGPQKELGLLIDMYYRKDAYDEAKKHPYRSVEFYPNSNEITTISLLSVDPMLDLGIVIPPELMSHYYRDEAANCLIYERSDGCTYFAQEHEMKPKVLKYEKPPVKEEAPEMPKGENEEPGGDQAMNDGTVTPEAPDKEFHEHFMRSAGYAYPHLENMHKDWGSRLEKSPQEKNTETEMVDPENPMAHSAYPSGSNGAVAAPVKEEKPEQFARGEEALQYAKTLESQLKKQQAQITELVDANKDINLRYAREQATRLVTDLESKDGVIFKSRDKEIDKLAALPTEEARSERVEEIRDNYARDNTNAPLIPIHRGAVQTGDGEPRTEGEWEEVFQYIRDKNLRGDDVVEVATQKIRESKQRRA